LLCVDENTDVSRCVEASLGLSTVIRYVEASVLGLSKSMLSLENRTVPFLVVPNLVFLFLKKRNRFFFVLVIIIILQHQCAAVKYCSLVAAAFSILNQNIEIQ
jgi:hypothetical protein